MLLFEEVERLLSVAGDGHLVAFLLERERQQALHGLFVVDDEDAGVAFVHGLASWWERPE